MWKLLAHSMVRGKGERGDICTQVSTSRVQGSNATVGSLSRLPVMQMGQSHAGPATAKMGTYSFGPWCYGGRKPLGEGGSIARVGVVSGDCCEPDDISACGYTLNLSVYIIRGRWRQKVRVRPERGGGRAPRGQRRKTTHDRISRDFV